MELEEMKSIWTKMSEDLESQKKLTDKMVLNMLRTNYRRKINNIWIPEILGSIICVVAGLYIWLHIERLDNWYLLGCGIISCCIFFFLPVLSIKSILRLRAVDISAINYKESLQLYAQRKKEFVSLQKLGFILGALLLVMILPVTGKLFSGKDLFKENWFWIWYPVGFMFFYYFSRFVFRYYMKSAAGAEAILKEIEN